MFLSSGLLSFFFPVLPFKKYCLFCFSALEDKDLADSCPFPLPRRLSRGAAQHLVTLQGCGVYTATVAEFLVLRVSPLVFPLPPPALLGFLCFFSLVFSDSLSSLWLSPGLGRCSPLVGAPCAHCVLSIPGPLRPGASCSPSLVLLPSPPFFFHSLVLPWTCAKVGSQPEASHSEHKDRSV